MNDAEYQEERARKLRAQLAAQETRDAIIYKMVPLIEQLTVSLAALAEVAALQLKLSAIRAGVTLTELKAAAEDSSEAAAPAGRAPLEMFSQTPEELAILERAHRHAVSHLGAEKAEGLGLGLYSYAVEQGLDETTIGGLVDEPSGVFDPEAEPLLGSPVRG